MAGGIATSPGSPFSGEASQCGISPRNPRDCPGKMSLDVGSWESSDFFLENFHGEKEQTKDFEPQQTDHSSKEFVLLGGSPRIPKPPIYH